MIVLLNGALVWITFVECLERRDRKKLLGCCVLDRLRALPRSELTRGTLSRVQIVTKDERPTWILLFAPKSLDLEFDRLRKSQARNDHDFVDRTTPKSPYSAIHRF